ncbi:nuclear transport factor 2 family protein [Massilia sp. IC2-477]|uniref:nuclear transport factor 2 family protein n=1 Tax=Massilia sp. IC2-477 TaxID=2887198 RepID=UPI001D125EBF|nr:nuclear transport factor 2 family protein [Massilia sp. IC2-477]MCC2955275.1 nuclear transport factor 2 family protein [Massilia sp. IC2-477]
MPNHVPAEIADAEARLHEAMLASDLTVLDELIDHGLIFTNHLGQVFGKHDDLDTHRSGLLRLARMDPSEMRVVVDGDCAIVSVRVAVAGQFGRSPFSADLRYSRVWRRAPDGAWRLVAAHASEIRAPAP